MKEDSLNFGYIYTSSIVMMMHIKCTILTYIYAIHVYGRVVINKIEGMI